MKKLFILGLIIFITGCANVYYPQGDYANNALYFYGGIKTPQCSICKNKSYLFKKDQKGRIVCDKCYRKIKKH